MRIGHVPAHCSRRHWRWVAAIAALVVALVPLTGRGQQAAHPAWPKPGDEPGVTATNGPSWLARLNVTLSQTSIGRGPGRYGPSDRPKSTPPAALGVRPTIVLGGSDIYRLNCQACHGSQGTGAPPEIKSAVDPIRGVPLEVMRKRLAAEHQPTSDAEARLKPDRVRHDVLLRVHRGGQRMPPREYLREADLTLLFDYLTRLAGKPLAAPASSETVGWARLGEQVVKGTCHICHDATGQRPTDAAMLEGAIPSLESLMTTASVADFVTKARSGAPVALKGLATMHRGRMPVFYYLRDEEIAAAYVYLATYPPAK